MEIAMERLCESALCTGCGACAAACPAGCIRMIPDAEGFLRPETDTERCTSCGRCRAVCPVLAVPASADTVPDAWAAVHTDDGIRGASTSGGVFTALSRWVLDRGGIVFGAAYDADFRVFHCAVEHPDDLQRLRGAKYAQSALGDTFRRVRASLREGRYVLFSGTPCQVAGLVSYLGRKDERLILVDLICHGVPSPAVWQRYISWRGEQDADGQKPCRVNLRSKETGWPGYSIRFDYPDGRHYTAPNTQDPYLRGFVGNLYLRPSCHACQFKGAARCSDFTLGDYWGVWDQMPEYHDGKGTSLVLLHTPQAKQLWNAIARQLRFAPADAAAALAENPSALTASPLTPKRAAFFAEDAQADFGTLVDTLCPRPKPPAKPTLLRRILRKLRRILRGG